VIAFAALSGPLPKLGVIAVAGLAACVLLARGGRLRAIAILGSLVLAPVLLLADIWHSPQLGVIHRHPLVAAVAAVLGLAAVGAIAIAIARRPALLGMLAVVALPFRIPIEAAGITSNLLVPLYLVVAAGSLAYAVPLLRGDPGQWREDPPDAERGARRAAWSDLCWLERLLALYIVLYALQAVYSHGFETALQQTVFFYVPFTLLFCLLRRVDWTPQLLRTCLALVVGLAVVFAGIGFVEYATKHLLLNPKLIATNNTHTYFTVNSVFFDPDIFGRFLALVMILLAAVLLQSRQQREQVAAIVILAILWGGLVLTLSRSSLGALLVGLGILAGLRWSVKWALVAAAVVIAVGAITIAISPKTFGLNQGLNGASSGRASLVTSGLDMFGDRPLWGYGSGSFVYEYRKRNPGISQTLAASHTIPITVAAEQGLIGELAYLALVVVAVVMLLRGSRSDWTRAALAAAFLALVFHTMLYADFLEDPVAWALLGVGAALAVDERRRRPDRAAATAPDMAAVAA
jgi:putative inorganic carbon (hco3(-)) transporter